MNDSIRPVKIYTLIGTVLCGCAGGIVGLLSGGILLSLLGVVTGATIAYFLKKRVLPISL